MIPFPFQFGGLGMTLPQSTGDTDPYFSNVSLLVHCDGTNGSTTYTDSSSYANTISANVPITTSNFKFGTGSTNSSGTNKYLECANASQFDLGTGDFTIEFFIYITGTETPTYFDGRDSSGAGNGPVLYATGSLNITYYASGSNRITGSIPSLNAWHHVAVCRSGTNTKLFLNGTQSGSTFTGDNINLNGMKPRFGTNWTNAGQSVPGNMDELRITKGVARYTANFTAPAAPFPNS